MALSSIALFAGALLVWCATVLFDRRLVALHQYTCFWASLYLWTNPHWKVTVSGREKIRPGVAYVMVSNHQSMVDILVGFRLFVHFKWVSKAAMFAIPTIGWNMRMNRYIGLRRGDKESIRAMYQAAERTLAEGSSVYLFPEGTRSPTPEVRPFKHGAFVLAKKTQVPILPIAICGSHSALPKKSLLLQGYHPIHVRVLDEISVDQLRDVPPETIAERVRVQITRALGEEKLAAAVERTGV